MLPSLVFLLDLIPPLLRPGPMNGKVEKRLDTLIDITQKLSDSYDKMLNGQAREHEQRERIAEQLERIAMRQEKIAAGIEVLRDRR